jgi:small-conductance mechanosensitive channel
MQQNLLKWIAIILAATLIGWLLRVFISKFLHKLVLKTSWKYDDLFLEEVERRVIFWSFLFGVYYTLEDMDSIFSLGPRYAFYISKSIVAVYVLSIASIVAKVIASMLEVSNRSKNISTSILGNIAKVVVYAVGILLVVQNFGIEVYPLLTTLGLGGLAVALALQPTLSNLFSGLQIIAAGKINIGDFIELENGKRGVVTDISWRSTNITTGLNNVIVIPNSKIADSVIENFFLDSKEVVFFVQVGVAYDSDLDRVERVSLEEAKQVLNNSGLGAPDFEPFVRFHQFGESSIDIRVFMRVKEYAHQFEANSIFIKALQKRFAQEGIIIPYPIRTLHLEGKEQLGQSK